MGKDSKISWCSHSFNPWWGCFKVSPGCSHCYAETFAKRTGHTIWGPPSTTERRLFAESHWNEPLKWNHDAAVAGTRARVFCASMADVFEDHPTVGPERLKLWQLIEATPSLDWLLLTKRPENVARMVPTGWMRDTFPRNVWMGTSAENQTYADERIPRLIELPAWVRFVSAEPLLGPVTMRNSWGERLHWLIAGGESGPGARRCDPRWIDNLAAYCAHHGIAYHFKQTGAVLAREWKLRHRAGADPDEWPEEYRVQQLPTGVAV